MIFEETPLAGVFVMRSALSEDERGAFARLLDTAELAARGLVAEFPQHSVAINRRPNVLRGLHYQAEPYGETKVVRCTRGAVFDVVVDLRRESETYARWFGLQLAEPGIVALYVPRGFAHGYVSLGGYCEVHYAISTAYVPDAARGVRWNDPALAISWPCSEPFLSPRDAALPTLGESFPCA